MHRTSFIPHIDKISTIGARNYYNGTTAHYRQKSKMAKLWVVSIARLPFTIFKKTQEWVRLQHNLQCSLTPTHHNVTVEQSLVLVIGSKRENTMQLSWLPHQLPQWHHNGVLCVSMLSLPSKYLFSPTSWLVSTLFIHTKTVQVKHASNPSKVALWTWQCVVIANN